MKKYLLGLFAVVLAIGFSAFTMKKAPATFVYVGSTSDLSQLDDPTKWVVNGTTQFVSCEGADNITCSFVADDSHAETVLGVTRLKSTYDVQLGADNIIDDIKNASNQTISPSSLTRAELP